MQKNGLALFIIFFFTAHLSYAHAYSDVWPMPRLTVAGQRSGEVLNPGPADGQAAVTFTLDTLIEHLIHGNFDLKIKAERVYQARHNILTTLSQIVPCLNYTVAYGLTQLNFLDLALRSLGFLYPSNWFRWRESKLFFEAERHSYAAMLANQINAIYSLYYRLSYLQWLCTVYDDSIDELSNLIAIADVRYDIGEDKGEARLHLMNTRLLIEQDRRQVKNIIAKIHYQLANVIDLYPADWQNVRIAKAKLPKLRGKLFSPHTYLEQVRAKSLELQEIEYLSQAAKFSILARGFDFLSPLPSNSASLGIGFVSNILIGKSQHAQILLRKEQLINDLYLCLFQVAEDMNLATTSFQEHALGYQRARQIFDLLKRQFIAGGELSLSDVSLVIGDLLLHKSRMLSCSHEYLLSKAVLDRLRLHGVHYQDLLNLVPKHPKAKLGLRMRVEEHRIRKAIREGRLQSP